MRRLLLLAAFMGAGGLVATACGLDSSGLEVADGGAPSDDATGPDFDGTLLPDDSGGGVTTEDSGAPVMIDSGGGAQDSGNILPPIDAGSDGAINCANPPTSPGYACTAGVVPSGWQIVEYVETSRPACTSGYGSALDVVEGPTGQAAQCECTCEVTTAGTCLTGNCTVSGSGIAPACNAFTVENAANGGACSATSAAYNPAAGAKVQVTPPPYTPGSCTAEPTQTVPPISYAGQGRLCAQVSPTGVGCPTGEVCAPVATGSGFDLCIATSGTQTCPAGFPHAHTIGPNATDTRGCSPCACGTATAQCENEQFSFFTTSACNDGGITISANAMCNPVPPPTGDAATATYVAYEYSAQVQNEACPPSGGNPEGGVSLNEPHTVCCQ